MDRQVSKRLNHLERLICVGGRGKEVCKSHQLKKEKTHFFNKNKVHRVIETIIKLCRVFKTQ